MSSQLVALYDGECGLCARIVQFILPRDRHDRFRFAPLQSDYGQAALVRHGMRRDDFDTFVLLEEPGTASERAWVRSDGAVRVLRGLGGVWALAGVFRFIPRAIRDAAYNLVAKNRFRFFGKAADQCLIPSKESRAKFLAM